MQGIFAVCVFSLTVTAASELNPDLQAVKIRLLQRWLPTDPTALQELYTAALKLMATQRADGSWADIDYKDRGRAYWAPATHYERLLTMATAEYARGQPLFGNGTLAKQLVQGLDFWIDENPESDNWWWNEINAPLTVGQLCLIMQPLTGAKEQRGCSTIMYRADWTGWTAANLVWMAQVHVFNGIFNNNYSYAAEAFKVTWSTLVYQPVGADGIQVDGSFVQHGQQVYNGGYGDVFGSLVLYNLFYSVNTSFQYPASGIGVLETFMLNGTQWMTQNGAYDFSVCGRAIASSGQPHCSFDPTLLVGLPSDRHVEFVEFAERLQGNGPPLPGNTHYFRSDYMVHRGPTWTSTVHMYSTRTHNSECLNYQGKKSVHMGDGVNYIRQTGQEYTDVFPTWDWDKVPGTTIAAGELPFECSEVQTYGKTSFVGGVSDRVHGVAAFDFAGPFTSRLTARKGWFFFQPSYVALGANITSPGSFSVATTLNQCLQNGSVYVDWSEAPLPSGSYTFSNVSWVYHDSVAYLFLKPLPSVQIGAHPQTGTWESIGNQTGDVTKDVFSLWVNHNDAAVPVSDGSYAYVVVPSVSLASVQQQWQQWLAPVTIAANTPAVQAVYNADAEVFGVIFFEAGSIQAAAAWTAIQVTSPCALIFQHVNGSVVMSYSDPSQDPRLGTEVSITVRAALSGPGCVSNNNGGTTVTFAHAEGQYAGSTATVKCSLA
eukprot:TRINITY_DN7505_c0_g2_i1.p1 TRINITY_DN7505_c0_g2~~TRINITY_DN7505_c0_g2_i1.p1  ORF type:complete len:714 (+),score=181.44 TRINITY_DN7505_c0_g2_i1:859-3000(+)